jgi:hypothetical protein
VTNARNHLGGGSLEEIESIKSMGFTALAGKFKFHSINRVLSTIMIIYNSCIRYGK